MPGGGMQGVVHRHCPLLVDVSLSGGGICWMRRELGGGRGCNGRGRLRLPRTPFRPGRPARSRWDVRPVVSLLWPFPGVRCVPWSDSSAVSRPKSRSRRHFPHFPTISGNPAPRGASAPRGRDWNGRGKPRPIRFHRAQNLCDYSLCERCFQSKSRTVESTLRSLRSLRGRHPPRPLRSLREIHSPRPPRTPREVLVLRARRTPRGRSLWRLGPSRRVDRSPSRNARRVRRRGRGAAVGRRAGYDRVSLLRRSLSSGFTVVFSSSCRLVVWPDARRRTPDENSLCVLCALCV